ncbi:hypothetical protein BV20DRAFT_973003 [Pilatotrama ljubarskyi]|nr:hypothetical protein BV20DRAFT_973003 [Pilatotrama ljubarskyi]
MSHHPHRAIQARSALCYAAASVSGLLDSDVLLRIFEELLDNRCLHLLSAICRYLRKASLPLLLFAYIKVRSFYYGVRCTVSSCHCTRSPLHSVHQLCSASISQGW